MGPCHATSFHEQTNRIHTLSCSKTKWSTSIYSQTLYRTVARFLWESSLAICIEHINPFQPNAWARQGPIPIRMDVTVENSELFGEHDERRDVKNLLLDITVINPALQQTLKRRLRDQDLPSRRPSCKIVTSTGAHPPLPTPYIHWLYRCVGGWIRMPKTLINAMATRLVDLLEDYIPTRRARTSFSFVLQGSRASTKTSKTYIR